MAKLIIFLVSILVALSMPLTLAVTTRSQSHHSTAHLNSSLPLDEALSTVNAPDSSKDLIGSPFEPTTSHSHSLMESHPSDSSNIDKNTKFSKKDQVDMGSGNSHSHFMYSGSSELKGNQDQDCECTCKPRKHQAYSSSTGKKPERHSSTGSDKKPEVIDSPEDGKSESIGHKQEAPILESIDDNLKPGKPEKKPSHGSTEVASDEEVVESEETSPKSNTANSRRKSNKKNERRDKREAKENSKSNGKYSKSQYKSKNHNKRQKSNKNRK